ncbi:Inositol 2-dehydrogenase [Botrimarina colliarenosi]|uniref:Inositol 2-dehydrogenase n=1 Tax=Botrimarina colliarenosi TaxID=2528001 RepID=A0A5C6ACW6_9BACT|nr:Gfo/Idh/MocA family oxidoreductase [Botrimarina colliarenosi]TWT97814.1 Inositol 2-dehydrogenase [Botrimarina colliarenosi]
MPILRRDFLSGAAAVAGFTLSGVHAFGAAGKRASDIRVGVVGVRSRGREHLNSLGKNAVVICDVDRDILDKTTREHAERTGVEAAKYVDYREMLERADIDAVSIATPNHTHCLIAIAAIEAGKDVYCEKPISHDVWEGRQLVAATRKHNRIVQCGTQSRSSKSLMDAVAWVQGGALGKIEYALGTCYKPRPSIGKLDTPLEIPSQLDYDLWCGPREKLELYRPQVHYDWHWDFNTGNGDMGNQGIHQMDIARWFLGEDRLAPRVLSIGGRLGYDDAGDTPNTQVAYFDYEAAPLIFETRGLPRSKAGQSSWGRSMDRYRDAGVAVIIQCEGGHVLVPSYTEAIAYDNTGAEVKHWRGGANHHTNWLKAIEAGDRSLLNAEIQEGHLSSSLCHVGGASHQLGERVVANDIAAKIASMPLLSASFDRMASHLRANDVDIDHDEESLTLGKWLEIDGETERFVGSDEADKLFRCPSREEFKVPDLGA